MTDSNALFESFRKDFDAAMAREVQIRTNYETGLIPSLERDLEASRTHVSELTIERDALLSYKERSEKAWALVETASEALTKGIELAPGSPPVG